MPSFVVNQNLHNAQKSRKLSVPNHNLSTAEILLIPLLQESRWYLGPIIKAISNCFFPYQENNSNVQAKCVETKETDFNIQLSVNTNTTPSRQQTFSPLHLIARQSTRFEVSFNLEQIYYSELKSLMMPKRLQLLSKNCP